MGEASVNGSPYPGVYILFEAAGGAIGLISPRACHLTGFFSHLVESRFQGDKIELGLF